MIAFLRDAPAGEVTVPGDDPRPSSARGSTSSSRPSVRCCRREQSKVACSIVAPFRRSCPEEAQVGAYLTALVRKELIRPDRPHFAGEDAFRFRHLLIRDAAYDSLPKEARAAVARAACRLARRAPFELAEIDELVGHHSSKLRLSGPFRPVDEHGRRLALRASELLSGAGSRALGRNDVGAAVSSSGARSSCAVRTTPRWRSGSISGRRCSCPETSVLPARRRTTRQPAPPRPGMKGEPVRVSCARG